eukprot:scaffold2250_cov399-Prasinococcus_capsulatus_cf.AAC.13
MACQQSFALQTTGPSCFPSVETRLHHENCYDCLLTDAAHHRPPCTEVFALQPLQRKAPFSFTQLLVLDRLRPGPPHTSHGLELAVPMQYPVHH